MLERARGVGGGGHLRLQLSCGHATYCSTIGTILTRARGEEPPPAPPAPPLSRLASGRSRRLRRGASVAAGEPQQHLDQDQEAR